MDYPCFLINKCFSKPKTGLLSIFIYLHCPKKYGIYFGIAIILFIIKSKMLTFLNSMLESHKMLVIKGQGHIVSKLCIYNCYQLEKKYYFEEMLLYSTQVYTNGVP